MRTRRTERMGFEEVGGMPIWNFKEVGASIEGVFKDTKAGKYGDNYVLGLDDRSDILVFGGSVLSTKMAAVPKGTKVRITYMGEQKAQTSREIYKDFKVEIWKD